MHIAFLGGGSLGPVTPMLGVIEAWRKAYPEDTFVWIGTQSGPESSVVQQAECRFIGVNFPKLNRYQPTSWLSIPFALVAAWRTARRIAAQEKPDLYVTAGGHVGVPFVWAAGMAKIPVWVHQQDVRPGLANTLMAPFAKTLSTAWPVTAKGFGAKKAVCLGNPIRSSIGLGKAELAKKRFAFKHALPVIVILGGGQGSLWLNQQVGTVITTVQGKANIIHLTGKGKKTAFTADHYLSEELIVDGIGDLLAFADLVVCRAGMGTITELAATKKAAVVIPLPDSHQEDNAKLLRGAKAAVIVEQNQEGEKKLIESVIELLSDPWQRQVIGKRLHDLLPVEGVAEQMVERMRAIGNISQR